MEGPGARRCVVSSLNLLSDPVTLGKALLHKRLNKPEQKESVKGPHENEGLYEFQSADEN